MDTTKKKDYPPGWNDPPVLNYSPSNPPPKSRILNKRVAFPLGGSTAPQKPLESSNQPPTSNQCIENLHKEASEKFNKILENISNEIAKEQISQMLLAWQGGKFSENVQNVLTELSSSLLEDNTVKVNELHLKLAMIPEEAIKQYLSALKCLMHR
ncbi:hypothetical protein ABEB36_011178 [Hypothenemus hampei]|uniref:Uncharacterized protein n=1 Tax=Hypothenemus hampei TaxID=57062 RepID=A0ABD1EGH1_HYPHA